MNLLPRRLSRRQLLRDATILASAPAALAIAAACAGPAIPPSPTPAPPPPSPTAAPKPAAAAPAAAPTLPPPTSTAAPKPTVAAPTPAPKPTVAATTAPVTRATVTLKVQDQVLVSAIKAERDTHLKWFAMFEKAHPGIKIEGVEVPLDQVAQRWMTQVMGGAGPDVGLILLANTIDFARKKLLLSLEASISAAGGDKWKGKFFPGSLPGAQLDRQLYGMPSDVFVWQYFINERLFKKAGLDPAKPPRTLEERDEYARRVTGGGKYGMAYLVGQAIAPYYMLPELYANGARRYSPDEKTFILNSPAGHKAFKHWVELATVHKAVMPGWTESNFPKVVAAFAQETAAMIQSVNNSLGGIYEQNAELRGNVRVAPLPGPERTTIVTTNHWGINPNTKLREEAWKFIDFLSSVESQVMLTFGPEGEEAKVWRLPSTKDAFERVSQKAPELKPFREALEAAIPEAVWVPGFPDHQQVLFDMMQEALLGKKKPEQALDEAAGKINKMMKGGG